MQTGDVKTTEDRKVCDDKYCRVGRRKINRDKPQMRQQQKDG